ncbi:MULTISPECIES: D-glycero-beta-D-manno-heptose-7-phosphate kinase [unclassified Mucilaginibacter]|uniref:D-glycero-beta-D-manno-heptose-7-phosphate kinase n=1 Tax=unclassified Mucilaginibacter TaxID=2617802 RepID=UPI002AC89F18|nr:MULTISPECIES: D-glycero-beta-D-manno-heptose-7-phosphate kinase [unclassified Mucilaginibacter]MEB0261507.1 D-glycero-beta-D-manno-heptose-7-phosphate kinase [Mucilaginibacter sp. 10I4]MEB0277856.1 D-glycero-beta-D-manno-heptose-7-phosphate kinase [Mucilaginibacter sp. 10B2]MEB0300597.1 D-glycero-beta-D-manno-heptose-7-phosphate kinase [Mucilaginibacter sp. 5C4]WPX22748.1 D-glycero-beta-D-manno-heptose-7-phosphate kinase [Mucilaginibacter sp. 5C4]
MLTDKVRELQQSGPTPNILVIGDLMIDHYIIGDATRLSPEAPVPIVNVKKEFTTPGGAANVAQNLLSLGAKISLAGITGDDADAVRLTDILVEEGINIDGIFKDTTRPTTVKTRIMAGSHQLVRVDREVTNPLTEALQAEFIEQIKAGIAQADIVIFSDYNKGLFSEELTQQLIDEANNQGKKVVIDPKGLNYGKYKGAYIIKPNRKELAEAAKTEKITNIEEVQQAARIILKQTGAEYIVVTLSEQGMVIISELTYKLLPVKATSVFDVTGAGDTVIATMVYFIAQGMNVEEACELANHAAAIVIRQTGAAVTTVDEILEDISGRS